jgi:hypothetical protein
MTAPKHEVNQTVKSKGFSITASPVTVITGNLIPSGGIQKGRSKKNIKAYRPAVMSADKLYIRIGDGILRGSTIKARLLEMIVDGTLTVETLKGTFKSESKRTDFAMSLGALFAEVKGERLPFATMDPKLGAIPTFSMVEEKVLNEKVEHLASVVGYENFYLKVGGLLHDIGGEIGLIDMKGKIVKEGESCKIDVNEVRREEVKPKKKVERSVINPSIGEIFACAIQIDEFKKIRHQFMVQRLEEGASMKDAQNELFQIQPDIKEKIVADIRQKLEAEGATSQEIEQILKKDQMVALLDSSKIATAQQQLIGIRVKSIGGKKVGDTYHDKEEDKLLAKTSKMFIDAACYIDDIATENPRMAKFTLTAISLAIGGPVRYAGHYVAEKTGVTDAITAAEDSVKEWSTEQFIEKFKMNQDMAELLASGIVFGAQVTAAVIGAKSATKMFSDAKKLKTEVVKVSDKVAGRAGRQQRLRALMHDDKLGSADRGWLKQDANAMARDRVARPGLRVPPGKELAHRKGFEADKGYGYEHADLQDISLHRGQHKFDKMGKLNRDGGKK